MTGGGIKVVIIAEGDDAVRLRKRVACAARALGIDATIESRRAKDEQPRVMVNDRPLFEGLPRTEEIERRLALRLGISSQKNGG